MGTERRIGVQARYLVGAALIVMLALGIGAFMVLGAPVRA
jgi:hypothetical protein